MQNCHGEPRPDHLYSAARRGARAARAAHSAGQSRSRHPEKCPDGGDIMPEIVVASAARTAIGSFNGAFASVTAHYLGEVAIRAALERAGVAPAEVSEVVIGQILTAGQGQNPARQASVNAGIPVEVPAWGVNQLCGSGLRAVALSFQAIREGDSA